MAVLSRAVAIALVFVVAVARPAVAEPEHVVVQLKWKHQFQFAGFYAAQQQGYYRDAALDVELREVDFALMPVAAVLAGKAQYGTAGSEALLARMSGQPLVALAVIYQHSPFYFVTRDPTIRSPADLLGKKVMMPDQQGEAELRGTLAREGLPNDRVQIVREWKPERLLTGEVDAVSAYTTDELQVIWPGLVRAGTIRPLEYGVDFYGDTLVTSEAEIAAHPERVKRFREATLRGWEYAFAHQDEIIELILKMPGVAERRIDRAFLEHEVAEMRKLVLPDLVELGHMNPARFEHMARVYAEIGIHRGSWSLEGFLYKTNVPAARWPRWLGVALAVLAVLVLGAAAWAWQLRRAVRARTTELAVENTRRRDVETELRRSHEELEVRVADRTAELASALAQMEAFSYSVSHDLRAPLRGIDGLLRIIEEDYAGQLPADGKELLVRVQVAARTMGRLIDDLLTLAKINRVALERERVDVAGMIDEVYAQLAPQRAGRQVTLEVGRLPPASADPSLLRQVLVNLIGNAIKFTRDRAEAKIVVSAEWGSTEDTYRIVDNGAGFDMTYATKLFSAFERMHPSSQFDGTGVGLAIVKNIISRHGGRVGATATPNEGATFWFTLPHRATGDDRRP